MVYFVAPYYEDKDIMHNLWHIELVKRWVDHILTLSHYCIDKKHLMLAMYFHGFIYSDEDAVRQRMAEKGLVVKTLITGSVRGQDLPTTLEYMKNHVLGKNKCYLSETIPLCEKMNTFAELFYQALKDGIYPCGDCRMYS